MEDRETPRMRKYGESKTTQIMMATVPHVTSGSGQKISGRWIFVRQDCTCLTLSLCVTSGYVPQLQKKKNYPFNETVTRIPQHMQGI